MSVSYTSFFLSLWWITSSIILFSRQVISTPVLGSFDERVRDNCCNIWVRECNRCIGNDVILIAIDVGLPKLLIRIIHHPSELVQGSRPKFEYVTFQVTKQTLEIGLGFRIWTLEFGSSILTYILLGLGCLLLFFVSNFLQLIPFRWTGWFGFDHPLWPFFLLWFSIRNFCATICTGFVRSEILVNFLLTSLLDS